MAVKTYVAREIDRTYLEAIHKGVKHDQELIELLWRLNFEDQDRLSCMRDIEKFFASGSKKIAPRVVCKDCLQCLA